jgi:hypothetical protein
MSPFSESTSRGHNLAYASQNEDRLDRLNRKVRKLRTKIGGDSDDVISPFPEEPKGMHWETFVSSRRTSKLIERRCVSSLGKSRLLRLRLVSCLQTICWRATETDSRARRG